MSSVSTTVLGALRFPGSVISTTPVWLRIPDGVSDTNGSGEMNNDALLRRVSQQSVRL